MSNYSPLTKRRSTLHKELAETWTTEWIAAALSLSSLAALIILLASLDHKTSFDWHGVTVNALVSLLSTTSRASLLTAVAQAISQVKWIYFKQSKRYLADFETIDSASRDAISQISLLFKMPFGLASLGVVAAVLSLAFDPFAQQLIQNHAGVRYNISTDATAALPKTTRYDSGSRFGVEDVFVNGTCTGYSIDCDFKTLECNVTTAAVGSSLPVLTTADFNMQAAILSGLTQSTLDAGVLPGQLQATCPTGNCTWDSVDSLAICSQCVDLSDNLFEYNTSVDGFQQWYQFDESNAGGFFGNTTIFTLDNGLWLQNMPGFNTSAAYTAYEGNGQGNGGATGSIMTTYGTGNASNTLAFGDFNTLIWAMSYIRLNPSLTVTWPQNQPEAGECALYYCVKTFSSNMTNGVLYENETIADSSRDLSSWQPTNVSTPGESHPPLTAEQILSIDYDTCVSQWDRTDLRIGAGYNISQRAVNSISAFTHSTFATKNTAQLHKQNNDTFYLQLLNGWATVVSSNGQWSPSTMKPLVQSTNITNTFAAVARSMTLAMRSSSSEMTSGHVGTIQIIIRVQWPWITIPVLTVLIGLLQLAVSAIWTKQSGAPLWKGSLLAVFSHGQEVSKLLASSSTIAEMDKVAKTTLVDLFPEERQVPLTSFDADSSTARLINDPGDPKMPSVYVNEPYVASRYMYR